MFKSIRKVVSHNSGFVRVHFLVTISLFYDHDIFFQSLGSEIADTIIKDLL